MDDDNSLNVLESSIESYKESAAENLENIRDDSKGFEERNFSRWKPAFDHLEMLWDVGQKLGEAHGKDVQLRNDDDNNATMAALAHIFPKSLLVVQEIICLLKGGFPDGALTRWRSLHELSVTAMYIAKHGEDAAKQYLLSFHFSARRAAHQMNKHSDRAGLKGFNAEEIQAFDALCFEAEQILERSIDNDKNGEWPKITIYHPTFAHVEESVGMDHWRPWYKWASNYTHANHRPADKPLGLVDATVPINLVGASNSGFVDPFQLTALSLAQLVETYLTHSLNLDRIVHIDVFRELANEMADIALKAERDSKQTFETRNKQTLKD
ncbi:MAG: DUF5677 domain-containing protein [Roseovarius sp.]|nr:DUF5677 domain-containing protein [Roseovarius sp.]